MSAPAPLPMTVRQRDAYEAIGRLTAEFGRPPTRRELAAALGLKGHSRVQGLMFALRERGFIDWLPGRACSIQVLARDDAYRLPPELQRRLDAFCATAGELPAGFVADAVRDLLDHAETHADEIRGGGGN